MSAEIYHAAILRHARAAVGAGALEAPDVTVTVDNPLCGDRITLELTLDGPRLVALAHRVRGCILCEAAASVLAAGAGGASRSDLLALHDRVAALLLGQGAPPDGVWEELAIFAPVATVKSRHRCVLLPFEALAQALTRAER